MTTRPHGAAPTFKRRQPLSAPPLPLGDPDDAYEAGQDARERGHDHDVMLDRLDRFREPLARPGTVVARRVRDDEIARAA